MQKNSEKVRNVNASILMDGAKRVINCMAARPHFLHFFQILGMNILLNNNNNNTNICKAHIVSIRAESEVPDSLNEVLEMIVTTCVHKSVTYCYLLY